MKNIRELVERLVSSASSNHDLHYRQFRINLPIAARFSLEGTIARAGAVTNDILSEIPGAPLQAVQLLEWGDTTPPASSQVSDTDVGVDLTAILALAIARRVSFAHEVAFQLEGTENTVTFESLGHVYDPELIGEAHPDPRGRFDEIVRALVAMGEEASGALGGAIRVRNAACCLLDSDRSAAYSLLIVAIETLSRAFGSPPTDWAKWHEAQSWDDFFLNHAIHGQTAEAIRIKLLSDKQLKLTQTFLEYVLASLYD